MSDTEREYTPTTFQVRSVFALAHDPFEKRTEDFDRWLAAHDAQVRADERKKIAAAILTESRDANDYGTQAGIAWVSGWQQATLAAARIARSGGAS